MQINTCKLGYGGTKSEMERLLKDAEAISGIHYDIENYADVVDAIHVIQDEMGITGTTAKEAASTIQGSTAMMKSSWQNMLTGMANENADFETLSSNFIDSLVAVAQNLIPRIVQVISGLSSALQSTLPKLIESVIPMIMDAVPQIMDAVSSALTTILSVLPDVIPVISALIPEIVGMLISMLPLLVDSGIKIIVSLIEGISDAIPQLIAMLPEIIDTIVVTLLDNLSMIITAGINLLMAIIQGLVKALPQLVDYVPTIVQTVVKVLMQNLPILISGALQLFMGIVTGLIQMIPSLVTALPQVVTAVVKGLTEPLLNKFKDLWKKVKDVFKPVKNWFKDTFSGAWKAVQGVFSNWSKFFGDLWTKIKDKFSDIGTKISGAISGAVKSGINGVISSIENIINKGINMINGAINLINKIPKVNIGKLSTLNLPRLARGGIVNSPILAEIGEDGREAIIPLENNTEWIKMVAGEMQRSMSPVNMAGQATNQRQEFDMIQAFKEALSQMKIVLDDEVAGEFVERTVTRVVYS